MATVNERLWVLLTGLSCKSPGCDFEPPFLVGSHVVGVETALMARGQPGEMKNATVSVPDKRVLTWDQSVSEELSLLRRNCGRDGVHEQ